MRESRVCERVKFVIYNIAIVLNFRQHSARDFKLDSHRKKVQSQHAETMRN